MRRLWRPDDVSGCEFPVIAFDELAAGKLVALLDRGAPRDAWDVAQLPRIAPEQWPTARSRAIFIAMAGIVATSPPLLWKAENARAFASRKKGR